MDQHQAYQLCGRFLVLQREMHHTLTCAYNHMLAAAQQSPHTVAVAAFINLANKALARELETFTIINRMLLEVSQITEQQQLDALLAEVFPDYRYLCGIVEIPQSKPASTLAECKSA